MLDRNNLPVFYGSPVSRVHAVLDWVHSRVQKTVWDTQRLQKRFMRRTPEEILSEGDTLAMAPCVDRTVIAALALRWNEVPFNVVVHECEIVGFWRPTTVHLAVEIEEDARPYWFDFNAYETRFLEGSYTFRPDVVIKTLQLMRLRGLDYDPFTLSLEEVLALVTPKRADFSETIDWFCEGQAMLNPHVRIDRMVYDVADSVYSANNGLMTYLHHDKNEEDQHVLDYRP